jgi:hypothetical protein
MMFGVVLGGFMSVMGRVQAVRMRDMGVMPGLFVVPGLVVLGSFTMMVGGVLVMLGGGLMVAATLVVRRAHLGSSLFRCG